MLTFSLRKVADLGLLTFGTMSFDYFAFNLKAVVLNFKIQKSELTTTNQFFISSGKMCMRLSNQRKSLF